MFDKSTVVLENDVTLSSIVTQKEAKDLKQRAMTGWGKLESIEKWTYKCLLLVFSCDFLTITATTTSFLLFSMEEFLTLQ